MLDSALFLFLSFLVLAFAQSEHHDCTMHTSGPSLKVQFTPAMPVQTPPTSTVYGAIMTSYLNVIDCNYVGVENIDDNPVQSGDFFYKTTIDVLTIYRVGCMPETTAITRREFRGYDWIEETPQTIQPIQPIGKTGLHKRAEAASNVANKILDVANRLEQGIDPNNDNLTVEAYRYLIQINTALFAINLVNSGLPLNRTCSELRDPEVMVRLQDSSINPRQASDIVCFASVNGLFFNTTNSDLLSDLAALEYAIQVAGGFTDDIPRLCEELNLGIDGFLGIDAQGIWNLVCHDTNITNTWMTSFGPTPTGNSTISNETASTNTTITATGPVDTGMNFTFFPNTTVVSTIQSPTATNMTTFVNVTTTTVFSSTNSSFSSASGNTTVTLVTTNSNGTVDTITATVNSTTGMPPFANTTQTGNWTRTIIGPPISWPAPVTATAPPFTNVTNSTSDNTTSSFNYGIWKPSITSESKSDNAWWN